MAIAGSETRMYEQNRLAENLFLRDVVALREVSRDVLRNPGLTAGRPQSAISIELLQSVLAAEIICVMRYSLLAVSEDGLKNDWLATEFQAQANDERRHMAALARRIEALGGMPDFNPAGLAARVAALSRCTASFTVRLQQNLAAEQCVVEHYRMLIGYFEQHDPETAAVLEDILRDEEEHRSDMQDLLVSYRG
jgi:bacterioferritin